MFLFRYICKTNTFVLFWLWQCIWHKPLRFRISFSQGRSDRIPRICTGGTIRRSNISQADQGQEPLRRRGRKWGRINEGRAQKTACAHIILIHSPTNFCYCQFKWILRFENNSIIELDITKWNFFKNKIIKIFLSPMCLFLK